MWAIALGVAAFAVAAYELFTREPRARAAASAASGASVAALKAAAASAKDQAARLSCGMTDDDMARTKAYLVEHFGSGVSVREGLALLPSRRPPDMWPDFVRRTTCYLNRSEN